MIHFNVMRLNTLILRTLLIALMLSLSACAAKRVKQGIGAEPVEVVSAQESREAPVQLPDLPPTATPVAKPEPKVEYTTLRLASWDELEGLKKDDLTKMWAAWLQSCTTLKNKAAWKSVCVSAVQLKKPNNKQIQEYFKQSFNVYLATNQDATETGLITGYYQPVLRGSRTKTSLYRYPLYTRPDDLLAIDLSGAYPELAGKRLRGRLSASKVVPYYSRAEIETEPSPIQGKELLWVDDVIDSFFLQVQGSGIVELETGEKVPVGYADQNGMPYQSIGRLLVEKGELTASNASMQTIKEWARSHLDKLRDLLNSNPSYVFFKELPTGLPGPLGALGVPLTAERSVAVDPAYVPLGAPLFLSTTYPNTTKPLQRLMVAQDTGGAIKGGVRADFYWGAGHDAGKMAGGMKQIGKIWVLLPKDFVLSK